mgnify:CR=1 FL=1
MHEQCGCQWKACVSTSKQPAHHFMSRISGHFARPKRDRASDRVTARRICARLQVSERFKCTASVRESCMRVPGLFGRSRWGSGRAVKTSRTDRSGGSSLDARWVRFQESDLSARCSTTISLESLSDGEGEHRQKRKECTPVVPVPALPPRVSASPLLAAAVARAPLLS